MQVLPGCGSQRLAMRGGPPPQARWRETRPRKCCAGGEGTAGPQETLHLPAQWLGAGGRAAHLPCPHRTQHHAADTAGPPGPGLSLWDLSPCVKALEPPAPR